MKSESNTDMINCRLAISVFALLILVLFGAGAFGVPLSEKVIQQLKDSGEFDAYIEHVRELRAAGMDQPQGKLLGDGLALSNQVIRQKVLVILIDFGDKPYTYGYAAATPADFDSLLFSISANPAGSMTNFYYENSYGGYIIEGDVVGWYHTLYDHFEYSADYPGAMFSPEQLVRHAVTAADDDVDFSLYDNDENGYVDGLIIVHAGTGHEESGDIQEIHSHMSHLSPGMPVDGVIASTYTIQPEESAITSSMSGIGVFCHEWGHVLGLPDLYDIDYSSEGVGRWSLMASGSYNGGSRYPAHLDAWCKTQLGWVTAIRPLENLDSVSIPAVEYNPVIYRLSKNGAFTSEYWLVENRQRVGFDQRLPGDGLLIYHIDQDVNGNWNDWHPLVFVEQADGRFNLQYGQNNGDAVDPWPYGDQGRDFHDKTVPDSKYYSTTSSQVAVLNISDSDSIMTADLEVSFSRPWLSDKSIVFRDDAYGNGNMILEAGEKIQIILSITNEWAAVDGVGVTLTTNDTNLIVTVDQADYGTMITGETVSNSLFPFEFQIPGAFASRIDSFFFDVTADDGAYQTTFTAEANVGRPQILIVDDDNDNPEDYEDYLIEPVYQQRLPTSVWKKSLLGSPDSADLANYYAVMWLTGDSRDNILASQDIIAMKGYLNGGGNLFLTGQELAQQLAVKDPDFLTNYLHCEYIDSTFSSIPALRPTKGPATASLDSIVVIIGGANNQEVYDHIRPINEGVGELFFLTMIEDYGAVSYDGEFKVVFFAFGFEAIRNNDSVRFETGETVIASIMDFFGEFPTDVGDRDGMAANLPMKFILHQNYPNPFNPMTQISYRINGSGGRNNRTILELFNILGQHVVTLVDRIENPGQHSVTWDGTDEFGNAVASGLYFYRLTRDGQSESRKMILLK